MTDPAKVARAVGLVEGASYLALLGVAMPLKYVYGVPDGVRYVGMAHGLLFVGYVAAVVRAARVGRWPFEDVLEALAAAVLPLGPFLLKPADRPAPPPAAVHHSDG